MMSRERIAHKAVKAAIKRGVLERPVTCSECGYTINAGQLPWLSCFIKGHHDDYSKPLNIRWLCESCHKKWHLAHPELSLKEIGDIFGISKQRVCQLINNKGNRKAAQSGD